MSCCVIKGVEECWGRLLFSYKIRHLKLKQKKENDKEEEEYKDERKIMLCYERWEGKEGRR